ncbi:MAG TPA: hypothetical protein PLW83_07585 [Deltaproteobacteria bacterium]|mgnify:CR=1 FL=1|nr:hypothetical protein [Deltaproteobacteria bacterium]
MEEARPDYLMENPEEAVRLDVKTDPEAVRAQAILCGIGPGARVLDGGCGSGKTTSVIGELVQPGGSVRDADTIAAAQAAGVTMYFTGTRHFFH